MEPEIKIKFLNWDSDFFGYKIGALKINPEFSALSVSEIVQSAREAGYKLVYVSSAGNNCILNETQTARYHLLPVDEKITYTLPIKKKTALPPLAPAIQKYPATLPNSSLINLALQSGVYSRFALDPHFKNQEYEKLYTHWITRIVKNEMLQEVWVYTNAEKDIAGFITVGFAPEEAFVGLLAVNQNTRRKNIGYALMETAYSRAAQEKKMNLRVTTQKANLPACQLYEKAGFVLSHTEYVYHLWLP